MILDTPTQTLQVLLAAAHATTPLHVVGSYVRHLAADAVPLPILAATNGATPVPLVPAPADGQDHQVMGLSLVNADTIAHTVTIRVDDNGTFRPAFAARLNRGDVLAYEARGDGWSVTDASGGRKIIQLTQDPTPANVSTLSPLPTFVRASLASAVVGHEMSLWRGTGFPVQGGIPAAAAACNAATAGAHPLAVRAGTQRRVLRGVRVSAATTSQTFFVEDRLAHMGGLSGVVTTAQPVGLDLSTILGTSNLSERIGAANYSNVQWFLEWYTATGATGVTTTVNVTYDDASTGSAFVNVLGANGPLPATVAASRRYELLPAVQGRFIVQVNNITHPTTGTAGSYGVTAVRRYAAVVTPAIAFRDEITPALPRASAPVIPDNACLQFAMMSTATATGLVQGQIVQEVYEP